MRPGHRPLKRDRPLRRGTTAAGTSARQADRSRRTRSLDAHKRWRAWADAGGHDVNLGCASYSGHHTRHLTVCHSALDDRVNATASAAIHLAGPLTRPAYGGRIRSTRARRMSRRDAAGTGPVANSPPPQRFSGHVPMPVMPVSRPDGEGRDTGVGVGAGGVGGSRPGAGRGVGYAGGLCIARFDAGCDGPVSICDQGYYLVTEMTTCG